MNTQKATLKDGRTMTVRAIHDGLHLDECVRARIEKGS